uniref:Uncharacterized protein n=1 Tax=Anguilla anguilla TaxID=7936 RepID=A0A0E9WVV0_ANGAN
MQCNTLPRRQRGESQLNFSEMCPLLGSSESKFSFW